jgi:hypothetical protein
MSHQCTRTDYKVRWLYNCHCCKAPLLVIIIIQHDDELFLSRLLNFMMLKPMNLVFNSVRWKFFGLKARRVCYSCFIRPPNKCYRKLRDREIGKFKGQLYKPLSVSQKDLYNWFESFNEYVLRPDADDYVGPFDFLNLIGVAFSSRLEPIENTGF